MIDRPSTGTILRIPEIPGAGNLFMVDIVAAFPDGFPKAGTQDGFNRIWFSPDLDGIVETLALNNDLVFSSGMEAMDFVSGSLPEDIDGQIEVIVRKIHTALERRVCP